MTPQVQASPGFADWLASTGGSLAFSTYQAGKLCFASVDGEGRLILSERSFDRCMGLCADGNTLWVSSLFQLWRLENIVPPGKRHNGYDRLYQPQSASVTGVLNMHDLAISRDGRPVFVNTRFNCLATTSDRYSFAPIWKPPFISELVGEDRCHLNGLAMDDGRPRYVTAVAESDQAEGWRGTRADGGCIIDVPANQVVLRGLSMPHSPRLWRDRLWLLNAGRGEFGHVTGGAFVPVSRHAGFLRGLAFAGDHAVLGLSRARREDVFDGLPLGERLADEGRQTICALQVVDPADGQILHELRFEDPINELYDVVFLADTRHAGAIGLQGEEIQHSITIGKA